MQFFKKLCSVALVFALSIVFVLSPYGFAIKSGSLSVRTETESAHAVAFLAPAGIAAAGMGAEECLAAFAAIGAVTCGWSLKDYVGASVDDIASWTDEQVSKGLEALDDWTKIYLQDPDFWEEFDQMVQTEGGNGGNNGGGKDPKDFDNNAAWRALALVNGASLSVSALGFFADGIKNLMSLTGSLDETVTYPDLVVSLPSGSSAVFRVGANPVTSYSDPSRPYFFIAVDGGSPLPNKANPLMLSSVPISDLTVTFDRSFIVFDSSVSDAFRGWFYNGGSPFLSSATSRYTIDSGNSSFYLLSLDVALLLDKTYTNTIELDNNHEIADVPQAITGLDIDTIKQYLNQIASNPSTGTYTYVKPTTTTVRNTYADNLTETQTKPDTLKPGSSSGTGTGSTTNPSKDRNWKNLGLKFQQIFPFCLYFDMVKLVYLLDAEPKAPEFDWVVPSIWGDGEPFKIHFSLKAWDDAASVLRMLLLFSFSFGFVFLLLRFVNPTRDSAGSSEGKSGGDN